MEIRRNDKDILDKLRDPESRASGFDLLVQSYQKNLYWHIRKMVIDHDESDDLLQEVFIKVWKNIDKFRGDSNLYTWLYKIASNECLNHLNKKKKRFFISFQDTKSELVNKLSNSSYIEADEIQLKLQKALLKLPDKQRLVFNMKYFEDMKYEEIAEITDTSVGSLKASYHLAVKKIEEFLKLD